MTEKLSAFDLETFMSKPVSYTHLDVYKRQGALHERLSGVRVDKLGELIQNICHLVATLAAADVDDYIRLSIIPCLNLLNLMRCTESVKEVNKRKFSFKRCAMSNRCQVHNFLYA